MKEKLLLHLVLHVARLLEREVRSQLQEVGTTHEQGRYLTALAAHDTLTVSQLATAMQASQPSATTMVARLEVLNWVRRTPDPNDGRIHHIHMTQRGRAAALRVQRGWLNAERELIADLSPGELQTLHALLLRLRDQLGGRGPEGLSISD